MRCSVPVETVGYARFSVPPTSKNPRILLLVTENEQAHVFVQHLLTPHNWKVCSTFSIDGAAKLMAGAEFPVVLCDRDLSQGSWQNLLEVSGNRARPPRLIVFSRCPDDSLWGEVLNLGAYDLLTYPFEAQEIVRLIDLAAESWAREAPRLAPLVPDAGIDAASATQQQQLAAQAGGTAAFVVSAAG